MRVMKICHFVKIHGDGSALEYFLDAFWHWYRGRIDVKFIKKFNIEIETNGFAVDVYVSIAPSCLRYIFVPSLSREIKSTKCSPNQRYASEQNKIVQRSRITRHSHVKQDRSTERRHSYFLRCTNLHLRTRSCFSLGETRFNGTSDNRRHVLLSKRSYVPTVLPH